jgi:TRAP-type C4-dicarboxylate transport system permease small subunit
MLRRVTAIVGILVIPLALLLFAQWPLRDWLQAYSRQANDVAQMVFGLYAAVSITAATISGSHLALASHKNLVNHANLNWRVWASLACVAPWALFLLWVSVPQMIASVTQMESFSEGLTPGYFVLRMALVMLPVLVLAQAAGSVFAGLRQRKRQRHRQ